MIAMANIDLEVCAYCKKKLDEYDRTVDHLFPKSRGGKLSNDNKVPSCGECNKLKGSMSIIEFIRALDSFVFFQHRGISHLKKIRANAKLILEWSNEQRKGKNKV
jgi:hypothetical protein